MRTLAREIEAAVIDRIALALDDPLAMLASIGIVLRAHELPLVMARSTKLAGTVRRKEHAALRGIIARVEVQPEEVLVALSMAATATKLLVAIPPATDTIISLRLAVRLTRAVRALRLIHSNGSAASTGMPEPALIKLVLQAQRWRGRLADGAIDVATLAREQGVTRSYVRAWCG